MEQTRTHDNVKRGNGSAVPEAFSGGSPRARFSSALYVCRASPRTVRSHGLPPSILQIFRRQLRCVPTWNTVTLRYVADFVAGYALCGTPLSVGFYPFPCLASMNWGGRFEYVNQRIKHRATPLDSTKS